MTVRPCRSPALVDNSSAGEPTAYVPGPWASSSVPYQAVEHPRSPVSGGRRRLWRGEDLRTVDEVAMTVLPAERAEAVRSAVEAVGGDPPSAPAAGRSMWSRTSERVAVVCPWPAGGRLAELLSAGGRLSRRRDTDRAHAGGVGAGRGAAAGDPARRASARRRSGSTRSGRPLLGALGGRPGGRRAERRAAGRQSGRGPGSRARRAPSRPGRPGGGRVLPGLGGVALPDRPVGLAGGRSGGRAGAVGGRTLARPAGRRRARRAGRTGPGDAARRPGPAARRASRASPTVLGAIGGPGTDRASAPDRAPVSPAVGRVAGADPA